jgi:hypothetical protein
MFASRPYLPALCMALILGMAACEADGPTASTSPALKGKGQGSPPSKLISASPDYTSFPSPLVLAGGSFSYAIDLVNGHQEAAEIWVDVRIEQGGTITEPAASRRLDTFHVNCGLGDGVLPRNSTCHMTRSGSVSNSADGSGTLAAGTASTTAIATYWYQGFSNPVRLGFTFRGVNLTQ